MIEAKNITKTFNKQIAVNNISFNVNEGENFVLLGTSGCGKTTTLKMINRLIEPTGGEILIDQKNIKDENAETPKLAGFDKFPLSVLRPCKIYNRGFPDPLNCSLKTWITSSST